MKNLLLMASLFFGMAMVLTSCDPCANTVCTNATCNDGTCVCNTGYTKDSNGDCVAENTLFIGTYSATWNCNSGSQHSGSPQNVFDAGTDPQELVVRDLYGVVGNDLTIKIADDNVTVADQTTGAGYEISGTSTGSALGTSTISLTIHQSAPSADTCTVQWTK